MFYLIRRPCAEVLKVILSRPVAKIKETDGENNSIGSRRSDISISLSKLSQEVTKCKAMSRPKRKKEGKPWDLGTVLIIIWVIRERARERTERASPLASRLRVRKIIRGHLSAGW